MSNSLSEQLKILYDLLNHTYDTLQIIADIDNESDEATVIRTAFRRLLRQFDGVVLTRLRPRIEEVGDGQAT